MTIFNNSVRDVDYNIVSFLNAEQQIIFSGVNKAAYYLLSNNDHFKKLFEAIHTEVANSNALNGKNCVIQYLCARHPTNCWKVASCIFQTCRINFSPTFLNAAIPFEIKQLTDEQVALESELAEISAQLEQAKFEHEQTQHLLESDDENKEGQRILASIDRQAEFDNYFHNTIAPTGYYSKKPGEHSVSKVNSLIQLLIDFDPRMLPATNLLKYNRLIQEEKSIKESLSSVKTSLSELQNHNPSTFVFKNEREKIKSLIHDNLREFILEIAKKPRNLDGRDIEIVKSAFRLFANTYYIKEKDKKLCGGIEIPENNFCMSMVNLQVKLISESQKKKDAISKSNLTAINNATQEENYKNLLNKSSISIAEADFSMEAFTKEVESIFPYRLTTMTEDGVKADLRREILARYGEEALKKLDQSSEPKN